MRTFLTFFAVIIAILAGATPAHAQLVNGQLPDRVMGDERSPVVIDEYISLTCPHCADFYLNTLPELEKRYIDTGKVRIIMHDFPLDGAGLKAAALARCMPAEEFYPFVRILYENQVAWATAGNPESILVKYAQLGGLDPDRAKQCLNDQTLQNAIATERSTAADQYGVQSTPTFVFNKGVEKIEGAGSINNFATTIDRMLAQVHKK